MNVKYPQGAKWFPQWQGILMISSLPSCLWHGNLEVKNAEKMPDAQSDSPQLKRAATQIITTC